MIFVRNEFKSTVIIFSPVRIKLIGSKSLKNGDNVHTSEQHNFRQSPAQAEATLFCRLYFAKKVKF